MVLGQPDSNMQKNETRPLSSIHKNKLKIDERPKCETGNHQNPRGKAGNNLFDLSLSNLLLDTSPKARELKGKNELLVYHQDENLPHCKGNNQQN